MGRWADQDSDEQRLPHGMQRVGYDADTQTYTFRDSNGRYYESEEGNRYGSLHPVGQLPRAPTAIETEVQAAQVKRSNRDAVRYMLPFALLVLVFLLLLFNFVNGSWSRGETNNAGEQVHCAQSAHKVQVKEGDTCWAIAEAHSMGVKGVETLLGLDGNEKVDCARLEIGSWICVPGADTHR